MAELSGEDYKQQLQLEKDNLDPSYIHTCRLLNSELDRLNSGADKNKNPDKYTLIHHNKPSKLAAKVVLPIKEFPQINFSGRLLGPGGANLKALQEMTGCKMSILGRGSMRDKAKEEELRQQGGKYAHLNEDLHLMVEVFAPAPEAHQYIGYALAEVRKYLYPEFDANEALVPQTTNGSVGRGMPRGRGIPPRGRDLAGGPRGAPSGASPRGARGAPPVRGGRPAPRAAMRGIRGGGGMPAYGGNSAGAYGGQTESYATGVEMGQEDPYAAAGAYDDQQYGGYESYESGDASQLYQQADPSQQYYSEYGNEDQWATADSSYGKATGAAVTRGTRAHPYAHSRGTRGARR